MVMKKEKIIKNSNIAIYQAKNGAIKLKDDSKRKTIWATQAQIAEIFNIERSVITKHINNILKAGEISEKGNVQKMHIANSDKPISFYSLDGIKKLISNDLNIDNISVLEPLKVQNVKTCF